MSKEFNFEKGKDRGEGFKAWNYFRGRDENPARNWEWNRERFGGRD